MIDLKQIYENKAIPQDLSHKAFILYKMIPVKQEWVCQDNLDFMKQMGMILKRDLIDGATYIGHCRNSKTATWHQQKQRFTYKREKFGQHFDEDIVHPEDDQGFDIFLPVQIVDKPF